MEGGGRLYCLEKSQYLLFSRQMFLIYKLHQDHHHHIIVIFYHLSVSANITYIDLSCKTRFIFIIYYIPNFLPLSLRICS